MRESKLHSVSVEHEMAMGLHCPGNNVQVSILKKVCSRSHKIKVCAADVV